MKRYKHSKDCKTCPKDDVCNGGCHPWHLPDPMKEDADGPWVRYEDAEKLQGLATKEQLAEAATTARLPLLQRIKDLEEQARVLRADRDGGLPEFEVDVPMPQVKPAKVEGGVRRFMYCDYPCLDQMPGGEAKGCVHDDKNPIAIGDGCLIRSDNGDYMLFEDHLGASMEVVELARKPLIEQIKALEDQVREARDEARQDRMGFAGIVGMLRGVLCPPMDQDHLDELLVMVMSNDNETSTYAVKEIAVQLLRVNQNPCSGCGS